ncbi:MAG: PD-(D/E)XK nuclease family protein [Muribaculaceae bacterium]|nr:PD-(D/E)XK nuclease family protein [Muribaculaceae bacterium]
MNNLYEFTEFINSRALHKLLEMQNNTTLLNILGKTNSENAHTSMLAWIFSTPEFLNVTFPPALLLTQLAISKMIESDKSFFESKYLKSISIKPLSLEVKASTEWTFKNKKRIDICVEFCINKTDKFRLWIENKIFAPGGPNQLEDYYNAVQDLGDAKEYCNLFIFVSPSLENSPDHDKFIHITYQELYENVLLPLQEQLKDKAGSKCVKYLNEYIATLESISQSFNPIVKSIKYSECLKEIYDNYSDLFIAAISNCGTEDEKEVISKISHQFEIVFNEKREIINGYTALARRVLKLLLNTGVTQKELLQNLGKIYDSECKDSDCRVADTKDTMGAPSCYSTKKLGRPYIYINNQWTPQKADCFIKQVHKYYPNIKIIKR